MTGPGAGSARRKRRFAAAAAAVAALAVLLGIAGLAAGALRAADARPSYRAEGAGWRALRANGELVHSQRSSAPSLAEGDALELDPALAGPGGLAVLEVSFARQDPGAFLEVELRGSESGADLVRLAPQASFGVWLGRVSPGQSPRLLARAADEDYVGGVHRPVRARIALAGGGLEVTIDGRRALAFDGVRPEGGRFSLLARGGAVELRGLGIEGAAGPGGQPTSWRETFEALPRASAWRPALALVAAALLAVLAGACYLGCLCRAAPAARELAAATALALAPVACCFAPGLLGWPAPASPLLLAGLGLAGLLPALLLLRPSLYGEGPLWRGRAALLLAGGLAAAVAAGTALKGYRTEAELGITDAERAGRAAPVPPLERSAGPIELDAGNALRLGTLARDADVAVRVSLAPESIVHVRLRGPRADTAEGVTLALSTDPRTPGGFFLETSNAFERLGSAAPLLEPGPIEVAIEARDREFRARVDGREFAAAATPLFAHGATTVLAVRGTARVESAEIAPLAPSGEPGRSPTLPYPAYAALPLALAILFGLGFARFLRLPAAHAVAAAGIALLPAAAAFASLAPERTTGLAPAVPFLALTMGLLAAPALVHARAANPLAVLALAAAALGAGQLASKAAAARPWPIEPATVDRLGVTEWTGSALHGDLLHLEHPLVRRWNTYLGRHHLRGREYALAKRPGAVRVAFVGTSSTYGFEAERPYSFVLEDLLRGRGLPVETLNGACCGSAGPRLLYLLENYLLDYQPDVVVLSLFFNDAVALSIADESAYYDSVIENGRSLFADLKQRMRGASDQRARIADALDFEAKVARGEVPELRSGPPAERFAACLRRFADLGKEHAFDLVLVKEPVAKDQPVAWRREFYAALDAVGAEYGLPVVDPSPLLEQRGSGELFVDIVHPNDRGHAVMAAALADPLEAAVRAVLARRGH